MEKNKDFDRWNIKKKDINSQESRVFFHNREIWWCSLGINVGFEQDGTGKNFDRPVLIMKSYNKDIFFGVALTGKKKVGRHYFYLGKIDNRDSSAVLSQVRLIDAKRLIRKIGKLDKKIFAELKNALQKALFQ